MSRDLHCLHALLHTDLSTITTFTSSFILLSNSCALSGTSSCRSRITFTTQPFKRTKKNGSHKRNVITAQQISCWSAYKNPQSISNIKQPTRKCKQKSFSPPSTDDQHRHGHLQSCQICLLDFHSKVFVARGLQGQLL